MYLKCNTELNIENCENIFSIFLLYRSQDVQTTISYFIEITPCFQTSNDKTEINPFKKIKKCWQSAEK